MVDLIVEIGQHDHIGTRLGLDERGEDKCENGGDAEECDHVEWYSVGGRVRGRQCVCGIWNKGKVEEAVRRCGW